MIELFDFDQVKRLESALLSSEGGMTVEGGPGRTHTATGALDVDTKAQEEIAGMGNVRRRIVDALTEERVR